MLAAAAHAQTYAERMVRIVPFGTAGGPIDTIARLYADKLRERWKQTVLVEASPARGWPSYRTSASRPPRAA